jgi:uncharacterized protein with NRDE domain
MCTVLILNQVREDHPVVVAANRDEYLARPSLPPSVLHESPRVVAGLDAERSGTWMGATDGGFLAALTNYRGGAGPDKSLRSRGEIVMQVLRAGGIDAADAWLASIDPRAYNGFNLLYGDASRLRVAYAHGGGADRLAIEDVPHGVHVLPNDRIDSPRSARTAIALTAADRVARLPWEGLVDGVRTILGDHSLAGLDGICMHLPEFSYGTRSSTILALQPGRTSRYLFAPGPVCTTSYEDVTPLLTERGAKG